MSKPDIPDARVRVFVDMEGTSSGDFIYLIGMLIVEADRTSTRSFWANNRNEETGIFVQFANVTAAYENATIFHYGNYETRVFQRMIKLLPANKAYARLLNNAVNVLSVIYQNIYFPTYSNELKDVGEYLGCKWSGGDAATGLNTIVWRAQWEHFQDAALKERLVRYNEEDCHALNTLTSFLYCVPAATEGVKREEGALQFVEQIKIDDINSKYGKSDYSVKDFGAITERAYFDYQRSKIYIRTNNNFRTFARRKKKYERCIRIRPNKIVNLRAVICPNCRSNDIARDHLNYDARETLDLRISQGGIRGWVVRYRAAFHKCNNCGKGFVPKTFESKPRYGHSLISWAMDQHVSNRVTFQNIERTAKAHFGLSIRYTKVHEFKSIFVNYYTNTYRGILNNLVKGRIIHADETTINLQKERGYVWVLTSMEDVYYFYRSGREANFLHEMLDGFKGTLISDFYSGYDSLPCSQQKCLIHLIRDINDDLLKNPFDRELKALATSFGVLLRAIIEKIDRVGLRASELVKYKPEVDLFIGLISLRECESQIADKYVKRILKYRHKLFTFLEYDDVPWNNNNAEHAISVLRNTVVS